MDDLGELEEFAGCSYDQLLKDQKSSVKVPKAYTKLQDERVTGLDGAMLAYHAVLSEPRTVYQKNVSKGIWVPELKLVKLFVARGNMFRTMGRALDGMNSQGGGLLNLFLEPEEALFLFERGSLLVYWAPWLPPTERLSLQSIDNRALGAVLMSAIEVWHTLILEDRLEPYLVYSSLKRLGNAVFPERYFDRRANVTLSIASAVRRDWSLPLRSAGSLALTCIAKLQDSAVSLVCWLRESFLWGTLWLSRGPPKAVRTETLASQPTVATSERQSTGRQPLSRCFGLYRLEGPASRLRFKKKAMVAPDFVLLVVPYLALESVWTPTFCKNYKLHEQNPKIPLKLAILPKNLGGNALDIVWMDYECSCNGFRPDMLQSPGQVKG